MDALLNLIAQTLNVRPSEINVDTARESIDTWDSLAVINLTVALEAEYGVSLSAEDVDSLISVRGILDVLKRHGVTLAA